MNPPMDRSNHHLDYASFMALVERSSLGAPGARQLRRRSETIDALRVMAAADRVFRADRDGQPWLGTDGRQRHQICITAARNGNRQALEVLVADLTPLVWHVARGQGLSRSDAEKVVQSVWLQYLRNIDGVDTARQLAGWLIVTSRRKAMELQRDQPDSLCEDEVQRSLASRGSERDRRLWAAFRRLPLRCQELLRLTVLAGRAEYAAVADALRIPSDSVGPMRSRCLTKLRELLSEDTGSIGTVDSDAESVMSTSPTLFVAIGQTIDEVDPVPVQLITYLMK